MTIRFLRTVSEAVLDVARRELASRFRMQEGLRIWRKSSGDLVTEADLACQERLESLLSSILPGVAVFSEEDRGADSNWRHMLRTAEVFWLVDPLDGTSSFVRGHARYGVIVSLIERGAPVAGWIVEPQMGRYAYSMRDLGAWYMGKRVTARKRRSNRSAVIANGDFTPHMHCARRQVISSRAVLRCRKTYSCAHDYLNLMSGGLSAAVYRRVLPWDHYAGVLLCREAGYVVSDLRGADPVDNRNHGLLIAHPDSWRRISQLFLSPRCQRSNISSRSYHVKGCS